MSNEFLAKLNNVRLTPRKAKLLATLVRGKPVASALDHLKFSGKRGAPMFAKLINSAMSNATDRATVDLDRLIVSEVYVGPGPSWKRWLPRAQGRASPILKRTSRITLKVKEL